MHGPLTRGLTSSLVLLAVLSLVPPAGADAPRLFGANGSGGNPSKLYVIDPATGAVQEIGDIGFAVTGLAVDPTDGTLYGSTAGQGSDPGRLIKIDKATGAGTALPSTYELFGQTMPDIDFLPNGTLVGWANPISQDLCVIDKTTGRATVVGDAGVTGSGFVGLAVSPGGAVWYGGSSSALGGGNGLLRIDPTTGQVLQAIPYNHPTLSNFYLQVGLGMTFSPSGVLYGILRDPDDPRVARQLVTIDTATGLVTVIGRTVPLLDALAFDMVTPEATAGADHPVLVQVDIRPGGCRNPLNPKARGVLPVAVLGTEGLDVKTIDPETLHLEGVRPLRYRYEDVATPSAASCTATGPDGKTDLVMHFDIQAISVAIGRVSRDDLVPLKLTGALRDGTAIAGEDVVIIVQ